MTDSTEARMTFTLRDEEGNVVHSGSEWNGKFAPFQPRTPERRAMPPAPQGTTLDEYREVVNASRSTKRPDNSRPAASSSPWATRGGIARP
jgi:hypothetical protein